MEAVNHAGDSRNHLRISVHYELHEFTSSWSPGHQSKE